MTITKERNGDALTAALSGRLDTTTSPELDEALYDALDEIRDLTLDFTELNYISSAGLRVLLRFQRKMKACSGRMKITGANQSILEVFEITGFSEITVLN